jgi:hypothetical protein
VIPIPDQDAAATARYEIERALLKTAEWEFYIGDRFVCAMGRENFDFSLEWGKLIFAWWDDANSQSWRVTAYELDGAELRLQASRGFGREFSILTLRNPAAAASPAQEADLAAQRKTFAQGLGRLLARTLGGATLRKIQSGPVAKSSRAYVRLALRKGAQITLAIGVHQTASELEIEGLAAAGLIWLAQYNGNHEATERATRLVFCLPHAHARAALERLAWIDGAHAGVELQLFEMDPAVQTLTSLRPVTQYELLNLHPRNVVWPGEVVTDDRWRARILALAPDLIETRQPPGREGESFSIHGLEFARVLGVETRQVHFGVPGFRADGAGALHGVLTESNLGELEPLVRAIVQFRCARSPDRRHPLYRLREEAWLESLLRRDLRVLDTTLDPRFVYSQIPAWRGEQRSVLDLLGVTRDGRLAVIEVKASEDSQLPMQGLDYWICVEQARLRGEFQRRGLFPGVTLAARPPLLYLVAPRLRFHRSFAVVAAGLSPEIEAYQIGINQNWRAGVLVRTRERVNGSRNQTE